MKLLEFRPKLFDCLKNYSKRTFASDLMAGIIVGIVALPLAIAFGIASGVSPEKGIVIFSALSIIKRAARSPLPVFGFPLWKRTPSKAALTI